MESIKLSIVVPVYGVEKYLRCCVDSLLTQTLKDIEIILVDDNSPDKCPQICDEYAKLNKNVKVIHKSQNEGLGYARNTGIDAATGTFITFVDSDDYIDSKCFEEVCKLMETQNLDEARYLFSRFNDSGTIGEYNVTAEPIIYEGNDTIRKIALEIFDQPVNIPRTCPFEIGSSCTGVYRLNIIKNNNIHFLSERQWISEDYRFSFDYLIHSEKIAVLPRTYYHYRLNTDSLTHKIRLDRVEKIAEYTKMICQQMLRNGFSTNDTLYAFGYYVGSLRANAANIFMTNIALSDKKRWWFEQLNTDFFKYISRTYPFKRLQCKNRIIFWMQKHHCFYLCYILTTTYKKIKKNSFY